MDSDSGTSGGQGAGGAGGSVGRGAWGWSGMGDVSWEGCSRGRGPAQNGAGLGAVMGSGGPRRRSDMSGQEESFFPRGTGVEVEPRKRGQREREDTPNAPQKLLTLPPAPPTAHILGTNLRDSPARLPRTLSLFWSG